MANVNKSAANNVQISVVLNKSKREAKGCMLSFLHNGVIKCRKDDDSVQWVEFRLLGEDKDGNVSKSPMFATQGKKEVAVDAERFIGSLYGTSEVDIRFTFDLKPDVTDALTDGGKALKITFGLNDLKEEGETEYNGQWTKKIRVLNPTVEVQDSYHGIGRTIDPDALATALEASVTTSKSQYVTQQELVESAEKLVGKSRNAKRKEKKREEHASLLNAVATVAVTSPVIDSTTPTEDNIPEGVDIEVDDLDAFTLNLLG